MQILLYILCYNNKSYTGAVRYVVPIYKENRTFHGAVPVWRQEESYDKKSSFN